MKNKLDTICVQGGYHPKNGEARILPIYQSTTFKYESSDDMGALFDLEASGYFYTRLQNPTNDAVAEKICDKVAIINKGQLIFVRQVDIFYVLLQYMVEHIIFLMLHLENLELILHL